MSPLIVLQPARPTPAGGRHRDGFVLVSALLAVVLIGALAVGVLFATTEATRAGRTSAIREGALLASESALVMFISGPGSELPTSLGPAGTISHRIDEGDWQLIVYITRLDSAMYWIVAEAQGRLSNSGAGKRVGVVVRATARDDHSITIDPISEFAWSELF
ncbi:MAG: hypothetical protein ABI408_13460 [Gemmatimonadaceae bacterium]